MRIRPSDFLRRFRGILIGTGLMIGIPACGPSDEGTINLSESKAKAETSAVSKEDQPKSKRPPRGTVAPTAPDVRKNASVR